MTSNQSERGLMLLYFEAILLEEALSKSVCAVIERNIGQHTRLDPVRDSSSSRNDTLRRI